ncbi:ankyrin repeat-containing domain protein [Talaromyces proteolyticus]|uniref:Ankyrin repeat-containing domain protein n=1 Tax=Talaromyces proteolyticus TaxID=1131652 RepID=A0AAD4KZW1_9EURO|nr:ankyrin repeat-containing domain protein [Talaromyces proteolyticus]KAH8703664.1 ankyrin repeat-containing domain protein [Talaromyces proteolyticus]
MKRLHSSHSSSMECAPRTKLKLESYSSGVVAKPEDQFAGTSDGPRTGQAPSNLLDISLWRSNADGLEVTSAYPLSNRKRLDKSQYSVGWVCALAEEFRAALLVLDEEHEDHFVPGDPNDYRFGKIGQHNVIIASLPVGRYGMTSAATTGIHMARSFPNMKCVLLVGIGAAIPNDEEEIRLGDVVISEPNNQYSGVVQFDMGTQKQDNTFQLKGSINRPSHALLVALKRFTTELDQGINKNSIPACLREAQAKAGDKRRRYEFPGLENDHLFPPDYKCVSDGSRSCTSCDKTRTDTRQASPTRSLDPAVHCGIIASGNMLVKDAQLRDSLRERYNAICIEMEAAGLVNGTLPCIVIRGICDYADTHKNDMWHDYASLTAASTAKVLLSHLNPLSLENTPSTFVTWRQSFLKVSNLELHNFIGPGHQHDRAERHADGPLKGPLRNIDPLGMNKRHQYYLDKTLEGTWGSVFESATFVAWYNDPQTTPRVLYCHGLPGAGKSSLERLVIVFRSLVVKWLEGEQKQRARNAGLAYVYCRPGDLDQTSEGLLTSLAAQLVMKISMFGVDTLVEGLLPPDELLEFACSRYQRTYICIDAVDEMNGRQRTKLLEELSKIGSNLHIFITGRDHVKDKIMSQFPAARDLTIKASRVDLEQCIQTRVLESSSGWNDIGEQMMDKIIQNSGENFLFADKLIAFVLAGVTENEIRERANMIPDSLEAIYSDMLLRIQKETHRKLANSILAWVSHCRRPLKIQELQMALAIEQQISGDVVWKSRTVPRLEHGDLVNQEVLKNACLGIIMIDESDHTVRPFHISFQEYLRDSTPPKGDIRRRLFNDTEELLAKVCLAFLAHPKVIRYSTKQSEALSSCPPESLGNCLDLLDYASCFWGSHARKSPGTDFILTGSVEYLAGDLTDRYASQWYLCRRIATEYKPPDMNSLVFSFSRLHIAAYFGLKNITKILVAKRTLDINMKDCYGATALHWAAGRGHKSVVKRLLKAGADVRIRESVEIGGATALTRAIYWPTHALLHDSKTQEGDGPDCVRKGVATIVKLLLESGAPVNYWYHRYSETHAQFLVIADYNETLKEAIARVQNNQGILLNQYQTPLITAVEIGATDIMEDLVSHGADINAQAEDGWTALHWAVAFRRIDAITALLRWKIDVNIIDAKSRTALELATFMRYEEVIDTLSAYTAVDRSRVKGAGSDDASGSVSVLFNIEGIDLGYAAKPLNTLIAISRLGEIQMAKVVLNSGEKVDTLDSDQRTALSYAAQAGNISMINLLLDKGAYIHHWDKEFRTPLSWAAQGGHVKAAALLISHGSRIQMTDLCHYSPLTWAVIYRRTSMAKFLLERGADPDTKDRDGLTPLSWAAAIGSKKLISTLCKYHASLDHVDKAGRTPLIHAATHGHHGSFRALLGHGANMMQQDKLNKTALAWAAKGGYIDIVKELHRRGESIDSPDADGRTPLHWAAGKGHMKVVKYLVDSGVNVRAFDEQGMNALAWAAAGGHEEPAKYLIKQGIDVNCQDKSGCSPLSWMIKNSDQISLYIEKPFRGFSGSTPAMPTLVTHKGDHWRLEHQSQMKRSIGHYETIAHSVVKDYAKLFRTIFKRGVTLDLADRNGRTPVSLAAETGQTQLLRDLIDRGADPNSPDIAGRTPLSWAVSSRKALEALTILLGEITDNAVNATDDLGRTALSWAASLGNASVIRKLLDRGADLGVHDNTGRTPLSWAVQRGNRNVVELLLKDGIYPLCEDTSGRSLLSYAAEGAEIETFKEILLHDSNPDQKDKYGRTPLSWAGDQYDHFPCELRPGINPSQEDWELSIENMTGGGRSNIVEALLEKDVDLESRDQDLRTPLSWVAAAGYVNIVRRLLENGADVDAKDRAGRTPLLYAIRCGSRETVKALLDANATTTTPSGERDDTLFIEAVNEAVNGRRSQGALKELADLWRRKGLGVRVGKITDSVSISFRIGYCDHCHEDIIDTTFYSCESCHVDGRKFCLCAACFQKGTRCPNQHTLSQNRIDVSPGN